MLTSVPHLLGDWWLRESPGRALRTLARVALTLLLAVSLAAATFPSPGPPAWFLVVGPALLLALTVAGGAVATTLRRAGHREHDFLEETDPLNPETTMRTESTAFRLAARPLLAAAVLLAVPLVAMKFTDQVVWTLSDFVIMGGLVVGTGALFELALMKTNDGVYRLAAGVALGAAFLLFWINGAVGIIGSADNDANMMYLGVLALGIGGAIGAGFRPRGLARALFATALAHVAVGALALVAGLGSPWHVVGLTGTFAALFVGSGLLFRRAARKQRSAVAARES